MVGAGAVAGLSYLLFGSGSRRRAPYWGECPGDVRISEYRRLGRTGYKVSILTVGGCGPGISPLAGDAVEAVECAIKLGINMVDIAPTYGQAEARLAPLISKYRSKLVVAEKTQERDREGAWRELKRSLNLLGVGYFDIYQFHAVGTLDELDQIFGEGGALEPSWRPGIRGS